MIKGYLIDPNTKEVIQVIDQKHRIYIKARKRVERNAESTKRSLFKFRK